ncbi:hypothetical protein B0920_00825 [Massilia sp. KIM]|uniref:hypothetical protein n=1 Tax=Massilia sp. KIM TaxID=1955422 RepID=UPI00098EFA2D|nr:hypothetical protein [Massilia sp. KIM]OON62070.1 hypothetical protein B0920_00825 [Massilia sp. KIM]
MVSEIDRALLSGAIGGAIANVLCVYLRRWLKDACDKKDAAMLLHHYRVAIWSANVLLFCGGLAGIAVYQLGWFARDDWRGFAVCVGAGGCAAMIALLLLSLGLRGTPKEALVAYTIAQRTPAVLLYAIFVALTMAFVGAATSLLTGV